MTTINPCSSDLPGTFGQAMPFICKGAQVTVEVTAGGAVLAIVLAGVAGLAAISHLRIVRAVARVYMEFFRGASVLVQLFWVFYAMPAITGYRLSPIFAGVLTLGLNLGAYGSEVVRGALQSVPAAQREAAIALNLSPYARMRRVIWPQAFVAMVPPACSLLIELLKATSLVSAISVADMTYQANVTVSSIGHQFAVFGIVMIIYFLMAQVITAVMRVVERRAAARVGRTAPKGGRRAPRMAWTDPAAGGGEL